MKRVRIFPFYFWDSVITWQIAGFSIAKLYKVESDKNKLPNQCSAKLI